MRIGMIGLGTIATVYADVFKALGFSVASAADVVSTPLYKRLKREGVHVVKDYKKMGWETLDLVCVLTPVDTHHAIVTYALNQGGRVICEKLISPSFDEARTLMHQSAGRLDVIYHYRYGQEVLYFLENYRFLPFESIEVSIKDPYFKDGKVLPKGIALGGAWMDSGVNALSLLSLIVDLNQLVLLKHEVRRDPNTQVDFYAKRTYDFFDKRITIEVSWEDTNHKETRITSKHHTIRLDHSHNRVYFDGEFEYTHDAERLFQHYFNYFKNQKEQRVEEAEVLTIHEKTLEGVSQHVFE